MVKKFGNLLKQTFDGFLKDDALSLSAAIAYYSAFSLAPLLLIAVSIAGAVFGEEAVQGALDGGLRRELGSSAAIVVQEMVAGARKPAANLLMSAVGIFLLLLGASGLFGQLQAALNRIWDVAPVAGSGFGSFIKNRLLSFSMVLVCGFLLLISMLLTTALQAFSGQLGALTGLEVSSWMLGSGLLSFAVITLLFAALFKILPDVSIEWREVWTGALFTATLFMIGKYGISWYLGREAASSSYGSAGSLVVVLSWLYYSAIILLFGAEFTKSYASSRQNRTGG